MRRYDGNGAVSDPMTGHHVNRRVRSDLSVPEREEYIKAVLCLQSKPARAPKDQVPGALSRYDDFVATHATLAMMLHDTVR